ncbi:E3 ubiquitin-protein ligase At3g02290-like isoform X2 [Durio zibethinus]|uniref:RING-type E3 ubiquitin transferase n=1 Tax=Durio zibethinus TaxID=66656 RepID=A0A6P6B3U6_DURZI|nr:E3 ubiquitin-protein ligase At3g02290-like isoform X2 [Durio zibethinus]
MGSVCCCLHAEDFEDYTNPNSNYTTLFQRGELHSVPSSIQGTASVDSSASLDNSLSDMYRSPARPLPYDADTRYFRLQRDGLFSRCEKGSSHSQEESEPLRGEDAADSETLSTGDKWNSCEQGSKEQHSKFSQKLSSAKAAAVIGYIYSSAEEEDVCPTCLEEYSLENPKIVTKCSHHFHLGCIYEWMERSENCPVCGKVMVFNKTI